MIPHRTNCVDLFKYCLNPALFWTHTELSKMFRPATETPTLFVCYCGSCYYCGSVLDMTQKLPVFDTQPCRNVENEPHTGQPLQRQSPEELTVLLLFEWPSRNRRMYYENSMAEINLKSEFSFCRVPENGSCHGNFIERKSASTAILASYAQCTSTYLILKRSRSTLNLCLMLASYAAKLLCLTT